MTDLRPFKWNNCLMHLSIIPSKRSSTSSSSNIRGMVAASPISTNRQHAVSTAATLFLRLDLGRGAAGRPFVCDDLLQALDAIVGESRDSIFTDPVPASQAA
jgi:hypothetical protein